ncbi:DUF1573 domain-containing protein [Vibrio scophthalmi]|uniref:Uncharacterized protein n=1 Tax=Vibrio scophthalmi TaxID=45658 RepID=A0A1C7FFK7_9VIBR|nr:DUF1573 domain-containing protein [Vibrio scophthalmi]ANU38497.1 hypothetical protein VSVS05_03459 [Vibrio scophthalmi]
MATEVTYRCKNTGGPDGDCEHAATDEIIMASAVTIGDDGQAYCPGETVFGEPCGAALEEVIPKKKIPWVAFSIASAMVVVLSLIIWFAMFRGSALLRVDETALTFSPGQTVRVEIFNDGDLGLEIDRIEFSQQGFSIEPQEAELEVAPGESAYIRVILAQHVQDSIQSTMTIFSNSSTDPLTMDLVGNANPWGVADKLNSSSTLLGKE